MIKKIHVHDRDMVHSTFQVSLVCEAFRPREDILLFPAFAAGLKALKVVSTAVFFELPGVGEAPPTALAGVQLHASVDLHVRLELVRLPELPAAHNTFVGFLSGVDQQVTVVVLRSPELFSALFTPVRFDSGVQELVLLQLRHEQETFLADAADVRPVATVLPHVVQVQVSQVEGLPAGVASELFVLGVALLVRPERGVAAEALQADLTAERFHSGRSPSPWDAPHLVLVVMHQLLVFLQLTVVEKCLPTEVAHEGFLHTMDQHVGLQSPGTCEPLSTFITPEWFLSVVEAQVSLEVVLEAEAQSTGLTHEGFLSGVDDAVLQQSHLTFEGFVALAALEWALLGVRPLVDAQVAGGGEALAAGRAGVRPGTSVDGLVLTEALLSGEAFPADVAHEGFDLSVRYLVVSECTGGGEGAAADLALKWCFLQTVGCLVESQLPQQPKLPVALVAMQHFVGVVLLSLPQLMGQQVFLQTLGFVETFIAGAAREGFKVAGDMFPQLVFLMETFVTEFTKEPFLFVQLPPPLSLQLLLILFTLNWLSLGDRQFSTFHFHLCFDNNSLFIFRCGRVLTGSGLTGWLVISHRKWCYVCRGLGHISWWFLRI